MERSFSERVGIKPVKTLFQKDFMDNDLKNSLWNELTQHYWNRLRLSSRTLLSDIPDISDLFEKLWILYFKKPLDEMDEYWTKGLEVVKKYYFSCLWYEVYEFIEFVANRYYHPQTNYEFMEACNVVLKRELSAYRFVGGVIIPITSDEEIAELEAALIVSQQYTQHLNRALELLADKKAPDYRNSIKESISSVEALTNLITEKPTATLGDALPLLERKLGSLHPALRKAFSNLYGYTSDAEGIRHSMLGESGLDVEDAKFMLIACSAFINYLVAKADKAGLRLTQE